MAKQMTWYIAVVDATYFTDKSLGYVEPVRIGPLTTKQLESILKKFIYRKPGAIRIFQDCWKGKL